MNGHPAGRYPAFVGLTEVEAIVTGPSGESERVRFLVDSGAMYTLLPEAVWRRLGLVPDRTQAFRLADGATIIRQLSECQIRLPQGERHTTVILGEQGDQPLLGVVTLEGLGLMLNPLTRELLPMETLPLG